MKNFILRTGQKIKRLARSTVLGRKSGDDKPVEAGAANTPENQRQTAATPRLSSPVPAARREPTPPRPGGAPTEKTREKGGGKGQQPGQSSWSVDLFPVVPKEGASRFHDFALPSAVMHGIADENFHYCTPIQEKALPAVLDGRDLVGKANTGTGKSAVFLIGIFTRLLAEAEKNTVKGAPRALVVAPTRELVAQIAKDASSLGRHTGLRVHAVYGGTKYEAQMNGLRRQVVDVVITTPGRLLDFANKKVVTFQQCRIMVIDEADRMLDMGFIPDMRRIISRIPAKEERQTLLFSATLSDDVRRLAYQWCVKPEYVEAEAEQVSVDAIRQMVYLVTSDEKYNVLYNLIRQHPEERIMVFANMKSEVRRLNERLQRNGIECALLSGDVAQDKRESRLERFRDGKIKVLVATDVAGRGIHIEGISFVVNFTLPYEPEDYVHRIGRTGRAGAAGISVSFACEEDSFVLPEIEAFIGRSLACEVPPPELVVAPPAPGPAAPKSGARKRRGRSGSGRRGRSGRKGGTGTAKSS
ncbi:MAG: DEAD/DEAH box helicase [Desulfopila sp.]